MRSFSKVLLLTLSAISGLTTTESSDTTTNSQTTDATTQQQTTTDSSDQTTTESNRGEATTTDSNNQQTTTEPAEMTTNQQTTTDSGRETTTDSNREETTTNAGSETTTNAGGETTTDSSGEEATTNTMTTTEKTSSNGNSSCPEVEEHQALFVCPTGFRRHPKDCGMFYQCTQSPETSHLSIVTFNCPNGTVYDEEDIQCRDRASDDTCPSSSENSALLRGTLFEFNTQDSPIVSEIASALVTLVA